MESKYVNVLDEGLRILILERTSSADIDKELGLILPDKAAIEMPGSSKERLLTRLSAVMTAPSLGQVLVQKISAMNISAEEVASKAKLPASVVKDLLSDQIYANNVPIMLFKNLLSYLNISFSSAEKGIRKTFELLQAKLSPTLNSHSVHPAFRAGLFLSKSDYNAHFANLSDGKELYENKEALDKYLNRLNELLNH